MRERGGEAMARDRKGTRGGINYWIPVTISAPVLLTSNRLGWAHGWIRDIGKPVNVLKENANMTVLIPLRQTKLPWMKKKLVWANDLVVVKKLFKIAYTRHKITQQCRVRDQENIIILSAIYILILLQFETTALQRYKYDKRDYSLRFVTSWILHTVYFPEYLQRRFKFDKAHIRIWRNTITAKFWSINAYISIVCITICAICVLWFNK